MNDGQGSPADAGGMNSAHGEWRNKKEATHFNREPRSLSVLPLAHHAERDTKVGITTPWVDDLAAIPQSSLSQL